MDKVRAFFRTPIARLLVLGALILWATRTCQSGLSHAEMTLVLGPDAPAITALRADLVKAAGEAPAAYSEWPNGPGSDTVSFVARATEGTYDLVITVTTRTGAHTITRTVQIEDRAAIQIDLARDISNIARASTHAVPGKKS
ncbi:MAG TPA: hypothetical protein VFG83_15230 [Kofleriaceae bacterium]|nr:hypothetical protein [Kofleriaceae bacterium]